MDDVDMVPFNQNIFIQKVSEEETKDEDTPDIIVPEQAQERREMLQREYAEVVEYDDACEIDIVEGDIILVPSIKVEELREIGGEQFYFIKDQYVVGRLKRDEI